MGVRYAKGWGSRYPVRGKICLDRSQQPPSRGAGLQSVDAFQNETSGACLIRHQTQETTRRAADIREPVQNETGLTRGVPSAPLKDVCQYFLSKFRTFRRLEHISQRDWAMIRAHVANLLYFGINSVRYAPGFAGGEPRFDLYDGRSESPSLRQKMKGITSERVSESDSREIKVSEVSPSMSCDR
jgi:hypothetical protein